jgi:DNA-binding CsgD family transcriptional regulator
MSALSIVSFLETLAASPDVTAFRRRALGAAELIPGSTVNFSEVAADGRHATTVAREDRLMEPDAVAAYLELRDQHPAGRRLRDAGAAPRPLAISQVTDEETFRAANLYRGLYRQLGMLDQLLVPIAAQDRTVTLAIGRAAWGFTRQELQLAGLLQRVITTAHHWQLERERLLGGGPDAEGDLLAALTRRQAEVMRLVLSGRTNDGVARDLGISTRTVAKHLEAAYRRLGVRTRSEAAALLLGRGPGRG